MATEQHADLEGDLHVVRRTRRTLAVVAACAAMAWACSPRNDGTDGSSSPPSDRSDVTSAAGYSSPIYASDANWLCKPGIDADVCARDIDATVAHEDETTSLEHHEVAADAPIDCFYIYPTSSSDPGPNSDLVTAEGEETFFVYDQAARLTAACRVFAPVYRQVTLGELGRAAEDHGGVDPWRTAYDDVLDAFRHYLAHDNDGRGVVLVGHAQGAAHLRRLLTEEVDGSPSLRRQLVSAVLLGWPVAVPAGRVVGGDLQNVPLCASLDQAGCVVTYSSFQSTEPPPEDSLFGRPMDRFGRPAERSAAHPYAEGSLVAGCVNPAAPGGGSAAVHPYFQVGPPDGTLAGLVTSTPSVGSGPSEEITTPFVTYPDFVRAECVERNGFSYLALTVAEDRGDSRPDGLPGSLTPQWGTHLIDVNVALGDIVSLLHHQTAAYLDQS